MRILFVAAALVLASCVTAPGLGSGFGAALSAGPPIAATPRFEETAANQIVFVSDDGARLPAQVWLPAEGEPWMVVLALHGINSAAPAFDQLGRWLALQGVAVYAYDARGFGRNADRGQWVGAERLAADARAAFASLRAAHPDAPTAVLGGSLGAAKAIMAFSPSDAPKPDRLVLVAPGVMGWEYLPPGYELALRIGSVVAPWMTVAPSPGMLRDRPSTNSPATERATAMEAWRIHETRLDVLAGAIEMMAHSAARLGETPRPVAFLYGEKDHVIDTRAFRAAVARLPPGAQVAVYPDGHHLLLRDLWADVVYEDILAFLREPTARLPSRGQFLNADAATSSESR